MSPPHGNANVSISWSVLFALFRRSSPSCRHFKRHLLRHLSQLHHTVVGARARQTVRSFVAWSRSDANKAVISCVNDDRVDIPQTRTCCVSTRHCTLWPLEVGKNPNPASTNTARTQVLPRTEPNPNPNSNRHGSYSVLSLNETVGTFTHFTVNEEFYFT